MISRRLLVPLAIFGLFLGHWSESAAANAGRGGQKPKNVVVILADDLGWSDLDCYGADLHETPNLDKMAKDGMRFTRAYAASPVCSPTRGSLLTGSHPARLHMTIWRESAANPPRDRPLIPPVTIENLPRSKASLAEQFHDAGYLTAVVGKWHLGDMAHGPEAHGFDVNIGGTHWGAPTSFFYPYRGPFGSEKEFRYIPHLELGKEGEYLTDRLTKEAVRVIDGAGNRPFFLLMAHHAPHTPIQAKPGDIEYFQKKLKPAMKHQNPAYAAMIKSLDESVGEIVDHLERSGKSKDTVLVFTSDNGGFVGEYGGQTVNNNHPLRSGKGSLYEGGIRVPLIVKCPGSIAPGSEFSAPVLSTDLPKTLLETSVPEMRQGAHSGPDGISLAAILRDPKIGIPSRSLFFHYPHYYSTTTPAGAIQKDQMKLIEYFEDGRLELYDLARDPSETRNLAAQYPELSGRLHRELKDWRTRVEAQMPVRNPAYRP